MRSAIAIVCVLSPLLAPAQQPDVVVPPLKGNVRSVGGFPLADAEVSVEGITASVRTDARGDFSVANVPRGIHAISVRRIGYLPAVAEVDVPQNGKALTLVLVPARTELDTVKVRARVNVLAGVVVDEHDRPIAGAEVALVGDRLRASDTTGTDGWFTFGAVRSGPVVLHVLKRGYVGHAQSVNLRDWRGVVVHMTTIDTTLSKSRQSILSGLGNTARHVWQETQARLDRRNVQAVIITSEELAPLRDLPLGDAITRVPGAINLLREMQVTHNTACILQNGNQMIGQMSLDSYDTEDVEFVELYPPYMKPPSSVSFYMGIAGCSSAGSAMMDSGGIFYAVVWMKN